MLVIKPSDRISIPEILSHPWVLIGKEEMGEENDYTLSRRDLNAFSATT
jgi:hypothetical protein